MKRILLWFVLICVIISGCTAQRNTDQDIDLYDSRLAPEAIMATPAYQESETVLRIYSWKLQPFLQNDSIVDLAKISTSFYLVQTPTNWIKYNIEDGTARRTGSWKNAKLFTDYEAINAVSPDISIENIYCFFGAEGYADYTYTIYYKTNMGDYVYFAALEYDPMLMGAEQYFEFIRKWYEYQKLTTELHGGSLGCRYRLPGNWSVYDWSSPNFDPNAPLPIERTKKEPEFPWMILGIGAAVLAAATVTTILLICKKKKKKEEETTASEIPEDE